jgi:hypothetical protein
LPWYGLWSSVSWEANQESFKPDSGYDYIIPDGTNCFNISGSPAGRAVTDSREIMAFCSRPRSKAVGAQSGVAGVIQGGSVDMTANFGFKQASNQHSAQFNWNIQRLGAFYRQLGVSLGVLQPSTP